MLKIKRDINQLYLKRVDIHFVKSESNFYSIEAVDRVSQTQLQVSENFN